MKDTASYSVGYIVNLPILPVLVYHFLIIVYLSPRTVVRLGELNLETEKDCDSGNKVCSPPPQDFTPAEVILHPDFDTRSEVSDDVALIRLNRKAEINSKYFVGRVQTNK